MILKTVLSLILIAMFILPLPVFAFDTTVYAKDYLMKLGATSTTVSVSGPVTDYEVWRAWVDNADDVARRIYASFSFVYSWPSESYSAHYPLTSVDYSSIGTIAWNSPTRVIADDSSNAYVSLTANAASHYIKATNFNFNIPSNATILGITVQVEGYATIINTIRSKSVRLIINDNLAGNDKASAVDFYTTTTTAIHSYGNGDDLWGMSLTPATINNANFGVAFAVENTASLSYDFYVDCIRIYVNYSYPVSWKWQVRAKGAGSAWTDLHTAVSEAWSVKIAQTATKSLVFENKQALPFELRLIMTQAISSNSVTLVFTPTSAALELIGWE